MFGSTKVGTKRWDRWNPLPTTCHKKSQWKERAKTLRKEDSSLKNSALRRVQDKVHARVEEKGKVIIKQHFSTIKDSIWESNK